MMRWAYLGYGTVSKPYAASVSAMLLTTEDPVINIKEENLAGGMLRMM